MSKKELILKPIILRDIATGKLMYIKYDDFYLSSQYSPNYNMEEKKESKATLLPNTNYHLYDGNPELVDITVDKLVKMVLKAYDSKKKLEKEYTNLNKLVDKILLIEADFGKKAYWLPKLLTTIKIKEASNVVCGNDEMVGVYVHHKEIILSQKSSTINTDKYIMVNALENVDLDNITIDCGNAYEEVTSDKRNDHYLCTYQFNIIAGNWSVLQGIYNSTPIKFDIVPENRNLESLTLCDITISSAKNKFQGVSGLIADTAISNVEIISMKVTLGWVVLLDSIIKGDFRNSCLNKHVILSHCPRSYVPFSCFNSVESQITHSNVIFLQLNDNDEDDEELYNNATTPLLRLDHPYVKINNVEDLEVLIVTDKHYKHHGVDIEDNDIEICLCDKVIDVNGLGLCTSRQTIFAVDTTYNNPDYKRMKNTYHDSIFTMVLPLFIPTYHDSVITTQNVKIHNILTTDNQYKSAFSSFVGNGTPLEKLIKTSGKLSPTDRYNNEQIRSYLKFIKNIKTNL